jgi:hypothetical protein
MNRAFSNPTPAHGHYDDYAALLMYVPAVIGTGQWTIQPAMLSSTRLLEAQLDVTFFCTAGLVSNKNPTRSEPNALPIDAHLPLPTSCVCFLDACY